MNKHPKGRSPKSEQEKLEELVELASTCPEDVLNEALRDACDTDADMAYEQIISELTLNKLEFLWRRGRKVSGLRKIILAAKATKKGGEAS